MTPEFRRAVLQAWAAIRPRRVRTTEGVTQGISGDMTVIKFNRLIKMVICQLVFFHDTII